MDPVSITVSVLTLVQGAGKIIKVAQDVRNTIKDAPLLLTSIIAECTTIRTSLSILSNLQARLSQRRDLWTEEVKSTFEIAVSGCALILSVIEDDIQACLRAGKAPGDENAVRRGKLILAKDHLQELVSQLRGQQQSLALLIGSLQSQSIEEMRENIEDNRDILNGIAKKARHLYVESEQASMPPESLYGDDAGGSIVTSTRFDFDDEIIASRTYQRALSYLQKLQNRQVEMQKGPLVETTQSNLNVSDKVEVSDDDVDAVTSRIEDISAGNNDQTNSQVTDLSTSVPEDRTISNTDMSLTDTLRRPINTHEASSSSSATRPEPPDSAARAKSNSNLVTANSISSTEQTTPLRSTAVIRHRDLNDMPRRKNMPHTYATFNVWFSKFWTKQRQTKLQGMDTTYVKAVFVGGPGKSYALTRGLWDKWAGVNVPTVFETYMMLTTVGGSYCELRLWDTSVQEDYDRLRPLCYPDANVIVLGYAIDDPDSLDNIEEKCISEVLHFCPGLPIIFVGYRADLRHDQKTLEELQKTRQKPVTSEQGQQIGEKIGAFAYIECSSLTGEGIGELFDVTTKCGLILRYDGRKKFPSLRAWRDPSGQPAFPDKTVPFEMLTPYKKPDGELILQRAAR